MAIWLYIALLAGTLSISHASPVAQYRSLLQEIKDDVKELDELVKALERGPSGREQGQPSTRHSEHVGKMDLPQPSHHQAGGRELNART